MSSTRANRRRPRAPVKIAFGNDEDDDNNNQKLNNQEIYDEYNPSLSNQNQDNKNNDDINLDRSYQRAFFTINNTTVEVILENDILSWSTVTGEFHDETSRRKPMNYDSTNSVNLQNVYAVTPVYTHWNWSLNVNENVAGTTVSTANTLTSSAPPSSSSTLSQNSVLRGFQLHSYQTIPDNIYQEILVIFQSNDSKQIERWYQFLSKIILEYKPTRHILVICNPYSGSKDTRHTYNTKIKTMLDRLQYKVSYAEISDQCNADEVIDSFKDDFDSIDSLVIIGGDGSVINVINALIRYLAKENRTRLDMENDLPSMPFSLCIIPGGTTNIICNTIQGNTDHCTPLFHLIFNQKMKIDMSAIFDNDYNFVTANFSAGAGYPANVLKYFPRYSLHSPKTVIKKSFAKGCSNKNLQPIEVEIRYIPASQSDVSTSRCYRGCPSCTPTTEKSDDQVKVFDDSHIKKINRKKRPSSANRENNHRLLSAGKNSNHYNNEKEKNWKILHQDYLQVAVLTNACLWSYAPQGLAKFGHLADGLLDLIIIEPVVRKEFLRYIKRNGNSKNQYELPFTKLLKVKEIEIELKLPLDKFFNEISNTDNQLDSSPSDDSSNEDMSDNDIKTSGLQKHQPHPPSAPISEDSLRNRQRRRRINQQTQEYSPPILQQSRSIDASSILHFKTNSHQQSENEMDSPTIDPYGSTTSLRRSGIFRLSKSKKDKIPLPRTASARGRDTDDEKQIRKNRRSAGGTLRPARSLLSLLTGGNTNKSLRDSSSAGNGRRASITSRTSSVMDNMNTKTSDRRKKKPCMWNLDFSPYNSQLIRIKCFYRYLSVYGINLDPDTKIKIYNYSCFGRMG